MSSTQPQQTAGASANPLGIYEKALPKGLSWMARLSLARALGFDFVEMSVDETDERLARLDWSAAERAVLRAAIAETGVTVPSMCLSGHRRFPFGSRDPAVRSRAREIMRKAIDLSASVGLRTIQLAGYDVYYEPSDEGTRRRFVEGLRWAVDEAARIASDACGRNHGHAADQLDHGLAGIRQTHRVAVLLRLPRSRQSLSVERRCAGGAAERDRQDRRHPSQGYAAGDSRVPRSVPRRAVRDGLRRFCGLLQHARGAATIAARS